MYSRDKDGVRERKEDLGKLWESLHSDSEQFSESIGWFARKAIESDMHRKFEIMFATYLRLMVKLDNRVFLCRVYWDISPMRIDRVYNLLIQHGYAERIVELALGAANLYEQTKHKEHSIRAAELREIAEWYEVKLEQHQRKYYGDGADRKDCWHMIRISNRVFTVIYDMVKDGSVGGKSRVNTYFKCLEGLTDDEYLNKLYRRSTLRLINPRAYKLKKAASRFKPEKRKKAKRKPVEQAGE